MLYGLIGRQLSHSFSEKYFSKKFEKEKIEGVKYKNFPLENINQIVDLLAKNTDLKGFNVTIPYKEQIIPFLDELSLEAKKIDAVNTVKIIKKENKTILKGYNTDVYGFENSLIPKINQYHQKAIILGTGGASKAVMFVLDKNNIKYIQVSRKKTNNYFTYNELDKDIILSNQIIINTTPVGTFPEINDFPEINYNFLNNNHLLYDLIYNPSETKFLYFGKKQGAKIINGLKMLELQAEKAWEIWNK